MPDDALDQVLRMVAEGRLTAAEAFPIIEALERRRQPDERDGSAGEAPGERDDATARFGDRDAPRDPGEHASVTDDEPGRLLRVVVTEAGRPVVNLNIPLSLGRAAIARLPGLSGPTSDLIRQAIDVGRKASIVDIDDGGDGVRISIE